MSALPAAVAGTVEIGGDLTVARMGYGAMRVTGPGVIGWPRDREGAVGVLRRAVELGVDFIDTADSYGPETSELLIAEALHPYPDGLVIGTKGGLIHTERGNWPPDGRPEHLRVACEASLRRLRIERIDLYQLHRVDPKVPLEDSVGTLAELRAEGMIRHVGLSNVTIEQLERARAIVPIVSVQNRYSVGRRDDDDVVDACERDGLAFLPWYPIDAGALAAPGGPLEQVARERGATSAQMALAWLLRRSPAMLPIPGTSSLEHLEENVAAAAIWLTEDDLRRLASPR